MSRHQDQSAPPTAGKIVRRIDAIACVKPWIRPCAAGSANKDSMILGSVIKDF